MNRDLKEESAFSGQENRRANTPWLFKELQVNPGDWGRSSNHLVDGLICCPKGLKFIRRHWIMLTQEMIYVSVKISLVARKRVDYMEVEQTLQEY